ncbi:hypothetical protein G0Q06_03705 [Puniceicoccales bacterium CK1056]|uniref:Uncharacterized protein n=1 Tax=Oceanipulchritudo coccoides TaxID=2706888 RepID=A0A6B2LZQ1_9BACT|nr:hypothetical protein [Oceanipulchritudo coccoides]NDV61546.1 hypothetical protein [Oceanipulchritudo coccoides]
MKYLPKQILVYTLPLMAALSANAANFIGPDGGLWSDGANWDTGSVPAASEEARHSIAENRSIDIDGDYTIRSLLDGFADGGLTLGGTGTLTVDVASAAETKGLDNATGNAGNFLQVNGNIEVNNSGAGRTIIRNSNSASNVFRFNPGSNLILTTGLTTRGNIGFIEFNGKVSGGPLFIGSNNPTFNEGHDSTELNSVVFFNGGVLKINGGTVLAPAGKFQVNGTNTKLELNGANSVNGAFFSIAGSNDLLVDINSDQEDLGGFVMTTGSLSFDVDPAVTKVNFASSFFREWGTGTVTITGFKENTIRFGVNGAGLTSEQLSAINGGIYSLSPDGYLTEAAFEYWARFEVDAEGWVSLSPWIDENAYVNTAPFIGIENIGWTYMDEAVGVRGRGWIYFYDLEALDISVVDGTDYGYSSTLENWVYLPFDISGETASWLFLF